jgi:hypothetical protein
MTPFEIRLQLLHMAKEMLIDEYNHKCEQVSNNWNIQVENAHVAGNIPPDHPGFPAYPSENEIVAKVQALNNFVSNTPVENVKISRKAS